MAEKKPYQISNVVHWYYGNFCTRKCFNKEGRLFECYKKLRLIADSNKKMFITHKEFKDMIDNSEIQLCKLKLGFRKRIVFWKQFERWQKDPHFDPDSFE